MKICFYVTNVISQDYANDHCSGRYQPSGNKKSASVKRLLDDAFDRVVAISPAFVKGKTLGYVPKIECDGVVYPPSVLGNVISLIIFGIYLFRMARKEKVNGNDVVLCVYNYYPFTHLPALIVSKMLGLTVIQEVEDLTQYSRAVNPVIRAYAKYFETRKKRSPDAYILSSTYMKERLKLPKQAFVFQGLYDDLVRSGRARAGGVSVSDPGKKSVLYSGSIDGKRNVFDLLRALRDADPNIFRRVQFIITGRRCSDIDRDHSDLTRDGVKYLGFVSEEHLEKLASEADGFLNYQIKDDYYYGSFPSKVLDYLKYGKIIYSPVHVDLANMKDAGAPIAFYENADQLLKILDHVDDIGNGAMMLPEDKQQCAAFRSYLTAEGVLR